MDVTSEDPELELMVDGNAVAGVLQMLLGGDVTAVPGRCGHCGALNAVGAMHAYVRGPGSVLRCPVCTGVVLRIVETTDATYVDLRGASYLRFDRTTD
jgi:hypothetical protein